MKLSKIEKVARVVKDGPDYGLIESEVIQGISMLPVGTKFYTDLQMQEYKNESIKDIFEKYNIFDAEGRRIQLGDLLGGHEK